MAARTYLNDAGTWRQLRRIHVNDAGTWRTIRKVYVNDSGTWRTVFSSQHDFSIVAGTFSDGVGGTATGFSDDFSDPAMGSGSSLTLSDGYIISSVYSASGGGFGSANMRLLLRSVASDPGQSYISGITLNGVTKTGATASSYVYNGASQTASWHWFFAPSWSLANGGSYNGTIEF